MKLRFRYDATDRLTNVLYEALNPHSSPTGWTNEARYAFDPAGNPALFQPACL